MASEPDIRASDAERERVAELLRDHAAEGRLGVDELDERLRRAYAARTRSELDGLTADLPARVSRAPVPRVRSRLRERLVAYGAVMVLLVAIWAMTGAGYFWPVWPALGWGIAIVTGKGRPHWRVTSAHRHGASG
jgi:Domain of unknown function (DUF1707)/2TM domain